MGFDPILPPILPYDGLIESLRRTVEENVRGMLMTLKNYGRNHKKRKEYIQQGWLLLKKLL
jgi:hypothetical protein